MFGPNPSLIRKKVEFKSNKKTAFEAYIFQCVLTTAVILFDGKDHDGDLFTVLLLLHLLEGQ